MGVACNNFKGVDQLKGEVPSLSVALEVIDTAFRKYCLSCDAKSGEVFDLSRVLIAFNDSKEETFFEVAEFVEKTKKETELESIEVENGSMKQALEQIVAAHPEVRAIFMGTRASDPNAGWMDYFCSTSPGWPQIDLVAPILRMSYADVWRVIRGLGLDYCSLYARGYTSIGARSNTRPNPILRLDDSSEAYYLHADQLVDESKERLGRS